MNTKRKRFTAEFKAKVALEAIKGQRTVNEITAQYGVHATQVGEWKKQALAALPGAFGRNGVRPETDSEALTAPLYQQIGQLKVELNWNKKRSGLIG